MTRVSPLELARELPGPYASTSATCRPDFAKVKRGPGSEDARRRLRSRRDESERIAARSPILSRWRSRQSRVVTHHGIGGSTVRKEAWSSGTVVVSWPPEGEHDARPIARLQQLARTLGADSGVLEHVPDQSDTPLRRTRKCAASRRRVSRITARRSRARRRASRPPARSATPRTT